MDLTLDANHDLDLTDEQLNLVSGPNATAQKLKIRLQLIKGEYALDTDVGIPYFQKILVKNPDLQVVRGLYRRAITSCPGVKELTQFELTVDGRTRTATLIFTVIDENDETITYTEELVL